MLIPQINRNVKFYKERFIPTTLNWLIYSVYLPTISFALAWPSFIWNCSPMPKWAINNHTKVISSPPLLSWAAWVLALQWPAAYDSNSTHTSLISFHFFFGSWLSKFCRWLARIHAWNKTDLLLSPFTATGGTSVFIPRSLIQACLCSSFGFPCPRSPLCL